MPFEYFKDLITSNELHLSRLDQFNDEHEGYIPSLSQVPSECEIAAQRHAWAWRYLTFASCWHISPLENSLMWPSYGGGITEGVAIRSTAGKLAEIASYIPNSYVAAVIYDPWPNPIPPGGHWQLPIRKRPEFFSEAELRLVQEDIDLAIMDDFPQLGEAPPSHWPTFKKASFDGLPLIDEIKLNPGASSDLRSRVTMLARDARIICSINDSALKPAPIWFDPNS
jgi:hypothetical protein